MTIACKALLMVLRSNMAFYLLSQLFVTCYNTRVAFTSESSNSKFIVYEALVPLVVKGYVKRQFVRLVVEGNGDPNIEQVKNIVIEEHN